MNNNEEQKKGEAGDKKENEAGKNPPTEKTVESFPNSPDLPVAGGSQEPKQTEQASSQAQAESSSSELPGRSVEDKESVNVDTEMDGSVEPTRPQLKRKSDTNIAYPGFFTKTFVIEISDEDSDSDSSMDCSPPANGPQDCEEKKKE